MSEENNEHAVEVEVTQDMLDQDPTLEEKGFKLGDKVARPETDEEREAREKHDAEVAADEANAKRDEENAGDEEAGEGAGGAGETNGERHPLA